MKSFESSMKWIMLVAGILTLSMVYAAFAPAASLQSNFGETLEGPVAEIVVRNWGALIALVGGMLIYGAFNVANRRFALAIAAISKLVFVSLVFAYGQSYMGKSIGIAVWVDSLEVVLFGLYLAMSSKSSPPEMTSAEAS